MAEAPEFQCMLGPALDRMAVDKQKPIDATPTPWVSWNAACRGAGGGIGLARGWHIIVAARSGNGKSLVGANLAVSAIRAGERVGFLSLEMSDIEMMTRVLSIASGCRAVDLEHGPNFKAHRWAEATKELHRIHEEADGCVYMNRTPISRLRDIEDAMRMLREEMNVRFFVIDYLQLAAVGTARDMLDRVTEVSMTVRGLAKSLGVTTVGMSQLNRESSKLNETPRKEGLMGGSPLENDAEMVLLLDHSRISRSHRGIESWAVLDKNRHGPVTEFPTMLDTTTLRMRERHEDELAMRGAA